MLKKIVLCLTVAVVGLGMLSASKFKVKEANDFSELYFQWDDKVTYTDNTGKEREMNSTYYGFITDEQLDNRMPGIFRKKGWGNEKTLAQSRSYFQEERFEKTSKFENVKEQMNKNKYKYVFTVFKETSVDVNKLKKTTIHLYVFYMKDDVFYMQEWSK